MAQAVPKIAELQHHPRWEDLWRTVTIALSTWDIGHKPSELDIELARFLDQLRTRFAPPRDGR